MIPENSATVQENLLLEAIKALSAEEICADTLENIPLTLATSGWRSTAALLTHAAGCADAGDYLSAERNRQRAREQLIAANDVFRQFQEDRAAKAAVIGAEAFLSPLRPRLRLVPPEPAPRHPSLAVRISVLDGHSAFGRSRAFHLTHNELIDHATRMDRRA